jgi:uncharacterized protein YraI
MKAMRLAAIIVLLSAASAVAEPAYVASAVNLRSGASTTSEIVAKIPGGSLVEAANCSEWCEVEWQGKKGFAIAASLDRSGRVPARRTAKRSDPFAIDVAAPKSVLDTPRSGYDAPERYYGPYIWSYGPAVGPYKGTAGLGYRGRW